MAFSKLKLADGLPGGDVNPSPGDVGGKFKIKRPPNPVWVKQAGSYLGQAFGPSSAHAEAALNGAGENFSSQHAGAGTREDGLPHVFRHDPTSASSETPVSPQVHSFLNPALSLLAPNECHLAQAYNGEQPAPSHPSAARPCLKALLSAAPASIKMADGTRLRRARSLPMSPTQCFKCLSNDHLVAACRDPVRCKQCLRYGHRSFSCTIARPFTQAFRARSFSCTSAFNGADGLPTPRTGASTVCIFNSDNSSSGANCQVLGALLYPSVLLWTFVHSVMAVLSRALPLAGLPRVVVRDLPTPVRLRTPPPTTLRLGFSDSDGEGLAARRQPRSMIPSPSNLIEEEEHEVSFRRRRAHRKRATDSASKKRRSLRLAAKEDPFYTDTITKATRVKAAKMDFSKVSRGMKNELVQSRVLERPPLTRSAPSHCAAWDAPVASLTCVRRMTVSRVLHDQSTLLRL